MIDTEKDPKLTVEIDGRVYPVKNKQEACRLERRLKGRKGLNKVESAKERSRRTGRAHIAKCLVCHQCPCVCRVEVHSSQAML